MSDKLDQRIQDAIREAAAAQDLINMLDDDGDEQADDQLEQVLHDQHEVAGTRSIDGRSSVPSAVPSDFSARVGSISRPISPATGPSSVAGPSGSPQDSSTGGLESGGGGRPIQDSKGVASRVGGSAASTQTGEAQLQGVVQSESPPSGTAELKHEHSGLVQDADPKGTTHPHGKPDATKDLSRKPSGLWSRPSAATRFPMASSDDKPTEQPGAARTAKAGPATSATNCAASPLGPTTEKPPGIGRTGSRTTRGGAQVPGVRNRAGRARPSAAAGRARQGGGRDGRTQRGRQTSARRRPSAGGISGSSRRSRSRDVSIRGGGGRGGRSRKPIDARAGETDGEKLLAGETGPDGSAAGASQASDRGVAGPTATPGSRTSPVTGPEPQGVAGSVMPSGAGAGGVARPRPRPAHGKPRPARGMSKGQNISPRNQLQASSSERRRYSFGDRSSGRKRAAAQAAGVGATGGSPDRRGGGTMEGGQGAAGAPLPASGGSASVGTPTRSELLRNEFVRRSVEAKMAERREAARRLEEDRMGRGDFDSAPSFPLSRNGKEYVPPPPIPRSASVRSSRAGSEAGLSDGRGAVEQRHRENRGGEAVEDRLMRYAHDVEQKRLAQQQKMQEELAFQPYITGKARQLGRQRSGSKGAGRGSVLAHERLYNDAGRMAERQAKRRQAVYEQEEGPHSPMITNLARSMSRGRRSSESRFGALYHHAQQRARKLAKLRESAAVQEGTYAPRLNSTSLHMFKADREAARQRMEARSQPRVTAEVLERWSKEREEQELASCSFSPHTLHGGKRSASAQPRRSGGKHEEREPPVEDRLLAFASAAETRRDRLRAALRQAELSAVTGSPDLSATQSRRRQNRRDEDGVEEVPADRGDAFARLYAEAQRQKERHEQMKKRIESASQPAFRPKLVASTVRAHLRVGRVSAQDGGAEATAQRGRRASASPAQTFDRLYTDAQRIQASRETKRSEQDKKALQQLRSSPLVTEPPGRKRWRERLSSRSRSRVSKMLGQLETEAARPMPLPSSPEGTSEGTASGGTATPASGSRASSPSRAGQVSSTVWERLHGRSEVAKRLRDLRERLHAAKETQQMRSSRSSSIAKSRRSRNSTPASSRGRSPVRSASIDRKRTAAGPGSESIDLDGQAEGSAQAPPAAASPSGSVVMDGGALSSSRQRLGGGAGGSQDVFERLFASPLRPVKLFKRGKGKPGENGGNGIGSGGSTQKARSRSVDPEKLYTRLHADRSKETARERAKKAYEDQQRRKIEAEKVAPTPPPAFITKAVQARRARGQAGQEHGLVQSHHGADPTAGVYDRLYGEAKGMQQHREEVDRRERKRVRRLSQVAVTHAVHGEEATSALLKEAGMDVEEVSGVAPLPGMAVAGKPKAGRRPSQARSGQDGSRRQAARRSSLGSPPAARAPGAASPGSRPVAPPRPQPRTASASAAEAGAGASVPPPRTASELLRSMPRTPPAPAGATEDSDEGALANTDATPAAAFAGRGDGAAPVAEDADLARDGIQIDQGGQSSGRLAHARGLSAVQTQALGGVAGASPSTPRSPRPGPPPSASAQMPSVSHVLGLSAGEADESMAGLDGSALLTD